MKNNRIIYAVLFALYLAALCFLCFGHFESGPDMLPELFGIKKDKIAHFIMFLPYPVLTYLIFGRRSGKPWRFILLMCAAIAAGAVLAWATEIIQGMTDYRTRDMADFRADCAGIFAGSLIVLLYAAFSRKW